MSHRHAGTMLVAALAGLTFALDAAALSAAEVYAKVAPSVWKVVTYDADGLPLGQGSAVVVGVETMATNCHVLTKARRIAVRHEKAALDAKLEMWDVQRDLCRITVPGLAAQAVVLAESAALAVGQNVFAIGNPRGLDLTISAGLISSLRRNASGHLLLVQTSAAISGGSSGGGLFDEQGRLVGLTTLGSFGDTQNLNFAIPAEWLAELPERHARLLKDQLENRAVARADEAAAAARQAPGSAAIDAPGAQVRPWPEPSPPAPTGRPGRHPADLPNHPPPDTTRRTYSVVGRHPADLANHPRLRSIDPERSTRAAEPSEPNEPPQAGASGPGLRFAEIQPSVKQRPDAADAAALPPRQAPSLPPPAPARDTTVAVLAATPSAAPTPPPAVNGAPLNDADALPFSTPEMRRRYSAFLALPLPRAFVISTTGSSRQASGAAGASPAERALGECRQSLVGHCFVYAVDDRVVYQPTGLR